jgi:hypothetical protein
MRSFIVTISAVAVAAMGALAAPLNERAAGPSGKLLSPNGGSTVAKGGALYVDYEPVEAVDPKSGQKTTGVAVNLVVSARTSENIAEMTGLIFVLSGYQQGSNVVALGSLTTGINTPSGQEVYVSCTPFCSIFVEYGLIFL